MKFLLIIPFCGGLSCSSPGKKEEFERKNIYQAQFYYERGFPGRALKCAQRIKKSSPRYFEAQEWIARIEGDSLGPGFSE